MSICLTFGININYDEESSFNFTTFNNPNESWTISQQNKKTRFYVVVFLCLYQTGSSILGRVVSKNHENSQNSGK